MKNTFSKLQTTFDDLQKRRQAVEAEVEALKVRRAELDREEADALKEGNVERYKVCTAEKRDLDTAIYVKGKQLESMARTVDAGTVRKMWAEYAADHDKDQKARMARLEKARAELKAAVLDLAEAQNEALKARRKCCEYSGIDAASPSAERSFPIRYVLGQLGIDDPGLSFRNCVMNNPDVVYVISMDESIGKYFNDVLRNHKEYNG